MIHEFGQRFGRDAVIALEAAAGSGTDDKVFQIHGKLRGGNEAAGSFLCLNGKRKSLHHTMKGQGGQEGDENASVWRGGSASVGAAVSAVVISVTVMASAVEAAVTAVTVAGQTGLGQVVVEGFVK